MEIDINYLAVLVATVVAFGIGWAWHSPLLFYKPWLKLSGLTKEKMEQMGHMTRSMVLGFLTTLLTAYVLAHFVVLLEAYTLEEALTLGFWIWLGFYAPVQMHGFLWKGEPLQLYFIAAGQTLVATLAMAAVIGLWS